MNKLTSAGNQSSTIKTTADKLFLLSEIEIFGSTSNSVSGEGTQYAYYKDGRSTVKKRNDYMYGWWERSPFGGNSTLFCWVDSTGDAAGHDASYSFGVAFAFCF